MQARMENPAVSTPGAMQALYALHGAAAKTGLDARTTELVNLRASQINGCSVCVDMHAKALRRAGESDERLFAVGAWRDAPWFSDAERVALELAEVLTRLADRPDPVSDELWARAGEHYDEAELAGLLLAIANINVWNRLNAATRQVAGAIAV
ncbi:carboxymuconolactone decarboxylase family protein [Conexibacter sp. JD483]|uniref:carboxymuconolactone decarboxylase family protein n=1 Tax=unclassified Conexibacter TaxID=2627773 RepID=UPI00271C7EE7|nr:MULTISPECIES: carboxymuconolactone decarboxylase family protein [unclassified Conexibacter]MDO8184716.1 carboxymuconolactone decarboxylase family protein [Conexibacter sp. CPCC 205706]MDO8198022.1 carboxymuconolactone decarboxylase family protein [Conexibacter sp. CPCC 205762]MDR9372313.1 carboxymuconolactone decarboxylase family protein [Conexibacter sp. JD483]